MLRKSKKIYVFVLCLVVILTSALLPLTASANAANILRPHLSWNQSNTATTMTVTWETAANTGSSVKYGTVSGSLTSTASGSSFYSSTMGTYIHTVTITGLSPRQIYYYSCGADPDWSAESSFVTAHAVGSTSAFRFGVITDTQNNAGTENATFAVTSNLVNRISGYNPDFVIHSGDVTTDGSYAPLTKDFFNATNSLWAKSPLMVVAGNHDLYYNAPNRGNITPSFTDMFTLPNNEKWYSYDYGNAHITNIYCGEAHEDGDGWYAPGTAQYNWIASDLSASTAEWKIINIHMPPYGGGASSITKLDVDLAPLFDQYGVDLVIAGHAHDYERDKSIKGGAIKENGPSYTDAGIVYMTAASGGGNLSGAGSSTYTAFSKNTYSFSIVDVNNKTISWKAYDNNGVQIDSFTITHSTTSSTLFFSGLESGQTAPTWFDTVDTAGGNVANVTGYVTGVNPECSPRTGEQQRTGSYSLMAAGTDNSTTSSYCYFKAFDVNIPVTSNTYLSYYIYPLQANGRYVSIDMVFTDGTMLRNLGCVDQNGYNLHPAAGHGGGIPVGAWSLIQSNIGSKATGKTIDRILVGYDQAASTGQFRSYFDDITVYNN